MEKQNHSGVYKTPAEPLKLTEAQKEKIRDILESDTEISPKVFSEIEDILNAHFYRVWEVDLYKPKQTKDFLESRKGRDLIKVAEKLHKLLPEDDHRLMDTLNLWELRNGLQNILAGPVFGGTGEDGQPIKFEKKIDFVKEKIKKQKSSRSTPSQKARDSITIPALKELFGTAHGPKIWLNDFLIICLEAAKIDLPHSLNEHKKENPSPE